MSFLKQIPFEEEQPRGAQRGGKQSGRNFDPRHKMKHALEGTQVSLKSVCVDLVHFINRGETYTLEQVEKIITQLQRSVLVLQKKKTHIIKSKNARINKKK